jgi:hypothetical protein
MAALGLIHLHLQSGSLTTELKLAPFTLHYAYRQVGADPDLRVFTDRGSILRREF